MLAFTEVSNMPAPPKEAHFSPVALAVMVKNTRAVRAEILLTEVNFIYSFVLLFINDSNQKRV